MPAPRVRRVARLVTAVVTTVLLAPAVAPPAVADPTVDDARSRAAALREHVDRLAVDAEVATERFNAAQERLGGAVAERIAAERALETARAEVAADAGRLEDRVRALYMAGGNVALLATVIDGGDLGDVVGRYRNVQSLVTFDRADVAASTRTAASAARLEARLARAAGEVTRLQVAAAREATRVETLLAEQRTLLAAADAEVVRLVEAQRAAAAAASARDFATALSAARAAGQVDPRLPGSTTPPNAAAAKAIEMAKTKLGAPYVWGAEGPDSFDCSGLTQWAYGLAGVRLPRVAADQWTAGPHPSLAALAPGDLLFWATDPADYRTIFHMAMYLGDGMMIVAPRTGDVVKIAPVPMKGFVGATRPTATVS